MSQESLISVIITTYHNPDNLRQAIDTVKNQTYKNLEIIVVDGANSEVNKLVIEDARDKRIKYVEVEPEAVSYPGAKGVQHARNVGCKTAKGKYVAMLDDDDEWESNKIELQCLVFEMYNNIRDVLESDDYEKLGLVTCWSKIYTEKGFFIDKTKERIVYKDLLKNFNLSNTSSYFMDKEVLEDVGWWDEDVRGMHEYDIALKMARKGYAIRSIPEPLLIRNRNYSEQLGSIYWKISEQFEFWHRYGKDVLKYLGPRETLFKGINTTSLIGIYCLGYVFQNRIWKVIYPLKNIYERSSQ